MIIIRLETEPFSSIRDISSTTFSITVYVNEQRIGEGRTHLGGRHNVDQNQQDFRFMPIAFFQKRDTVMYPARRNEKVCLYVHPFE